MSKGLDGSEAIQTEKQLKQKAQSSSAAALPPPKTPFRKPRGQVHPPHWLRLWLVVMATFVWI